MKCSFPAGTCLKLQKCLEFWGDFQQVQWSVVFQCTVLKYNSCVQTQHKWPFAQLKKYPEFRHYIKYTCPSSMKQAMVLSGISSWCQHTWKHKQAICKVHFLEALSRCVWSSFPPHSATRSTTLLKLCVWAQFYFTRRCVMRKKLFKANRFVLVLFISDVKLASQSIFQMFVNFPVRVSKLCLFLMASLWCSDSKWPVLLHEWLSLNISALVMFRTPGELIPEKLTQVLQNQPFTTTQNKILGALAVAARW